MGSLRHHTRRTKNIDHDRYRDEDDYYRYGGMQELDWPTDESRFADRRQPAFNDREFMDLGHSYAYGQRREQLHDRELDDEEQRWYSKYEGESHAPLQEHKDRTYSKE